MSRPTLVERLRDYQEQLFDGIVVGELQRDLGIAASEIELARREAEASRSKRSELRDDGRVLARIRVGDGIPLDGVSVVADLCAWLGHEDATCRTVDGWLELVEAT